MDEILDLSGPIVQWVQQWGYVAVFFGIMLENAGIPVPGETIIVIASVMAGHHGVLRVELIYLTVVAGAIIGDNIGYWVGMRGGRPLLLKIGRLWRLSEARLDQVEQQFRRHSDWAVFFGRFIALLRIFAGPMAGMMRMPWHRFFFFNATGALIWAAVVVGLAYTFGATIVHLLHHVGLSLLGLIVLTAAYFGFRNWRKRALLGSEPSPPASSDDHTQP